MDVPSELKKRIAAEDWEYFAHLAHSFSLEIESGDAETKRLHKELQIIRKVIHAYISNEKGREKFLMPRFLIKMYRTIAKLETRVDSDQRQQAEFLSFLRALLYKMKQEKLVVYKTLERTREFQRHKGFGDVL